MQSHSFSQRRQQKEQCVEAAGEKGWGRGAGSEQNLKMRGRQYSKRSL